jgi:hypothetical protein
MFKLPNANPKGQKGEMTKKKKDCRTGSSFSSFLKRNFGLFIRVKIKNKNIFTKRTTSCLNKILLMY